MRRWAGRFFKPICPGPRVDGVALHPFWQGRGDLGQRGIPCDPRFGQTQNQRPTSRRVNICGDNAGSSVRVQPTAAALKIRAPPARNAQCPGTKCDPTHPFLVPDVQQSPAAATSIRPPATEKADLTWPCSANGFWQQTCSMKTPSQSTTATKMLTRHQATKSRCSRIATLRILKARPLP